MKRLHLEQKVVTFRSSFREHRKHLPLLCFSLDLLVGEEEHLGLLTTRNHTFNSSTDMKLEVNWISCSAHNLGFRQFFAQFHQEMISAIRFSTVSVYIFYNQTVYEFRDPISRMFIKSWKGHQEVRQAQVYSITNLSALSTRLLI